MAGHERASLSTEVIAIVRCSGEFDLSTASLLRDEFDRLREVGMTRAVVDLTDVSFLDSAAMAALVYGRKRVGALSVRGLNDVTRAAFHHAGLDDVIAEV